MKYISTRGEKKNRKFTDILLEGLAEDGGLYLPEVYPKFTDWDLTTWRKLEYSELALEILKKFKVDINEKDLKNILGKSYNEKIFNNSRKNSLNKKIAPVIQLESNLFIQELSNGPTLAFKDMAMQFLGNLFEYVLAKKKKRLNILGATSGDTGSAAEYALSGKKNINVFMLSPNGKMSTFQRAQMYSLQEPNIFNIAINGVFDDAQDIVKKVSMDSVFKKKYSIGAVNSINWARVLAQVVYYVYAYLQVSKKNSEKVSFAVPTGNFGNICAGHIAKMCGLPVDRLILATNENNVLDEFFKTGIYRPRKSSETYITSSPSMDISKASNFERFVFDLFSGNTSKVKKLFREVEDKGYFDISKTPEFKTIENFGFITHASSHSDRIDIIKKVHEKYKILIDTHTADAFATTFFLRRSNEKVVVLETAQATKFKEDVSRAIGKEIVIPKKFQKLTKLIQKVFITDPDVMQIKDFISKNS